MSDTPYEHRCDPDAAQLVVDVAMAFAELSSVSWWNWRGREEASSKFTARAYKLSTMIEHGAISEPVRKVLGPILSAMEAEYEKL